MRFVWDNHQGSEVASVTRSVPWQCCALQAGIPAAKLGLKKRHFNQKGT